MCSYYSSNDTLSARIACEVSSSDEMYTSMLLTSRFEGVAGDLRVDLGYVENFTYSGTHAIFSIHLLYNLFTEKYSMDYSPPFLFNRLLRISFTSISIHGHQLMCIHQEKIATYLFI